MDGTARLEPKGSKGHTMSVIDLAPSQEQAPPRLPKAARLIKKVLLVVVALALVFYSGGGWYFSDVLDQRALDATERLTALEPNYAHQVVALEEGTITLTLPEPPGDLLRPGTWGVGWPGGYGLASTITDATASTVTREFRVIQGQPPGPGTVVEFETTAVPDDPTGALQPAPTLITYQGPLGQYPAWWFPGEGSTWVVMTHGNGLNIADHVKLVPALHGAGYPVLAIAYRNAPGAPADPSGKLHYGATEWADLEAAVAYAVEQGAEHVFLVGPSMGGAVITRFLYDSEFADVVLAAVVEAPMLDFGRSVDLNAARETLPVVGIAVPQSLTSVAKWIASLRFGVDWESMNLVARAGDLGHPMLIFHGIDDTDVPIATSREFAELRPDLVTLVEVDGAPHMGAWNVGPAAFEARLLSFLAEHDPASD